MDHHCGHKHFREGYGQWRCRYNFPELWGRLKWVYRPGKFVNYLDLRLGPENKNTRK